MTNTQAKKSGWKVTGPKGSSQVYETLRQANVAAERWNQQYGAAVHGVRYCDAAL